MTQKLETVSTFWAGVIWPGRVIWTWLLMESLQGYGSSSEECRSRWQDRRQNLKWLCVNDRASPGGELTAWCYCSKGRCDSQAQEWKKDREMKTQQSFSILPISLFLLKTGFNLVGSLEMLLGAWCVRIWSISPWLSEEFTMDSLIDTCEVQLWKVWLLLVLNLQSL